MESRKGTLSALKQCRFCLSQEELTSLYKTNKLTKNVVSLPLKIMSCVSVEVFPSDKMPTFICSRCKFFMDIFYEFKNICRQADENILQFIENGNQLESIAWPSSLIKIFLAHPKQSEVAVMKVDSGATVQLTTQDLSDTDMEDDENVYNIKIGDGSDDESKSARIKLITGNDKDDPLKKKLTKKIRKDSEETDMLPEKTTSTDIDEGCWACDQCDCTYPLQQLLELHKMQKHRYRNAQCDQCDAKFFTKYDLAIHQLRHSSEMLFQCVACDKKFKRHILLKRHEKVMHADLPQRVCLKCPASFLSLEELEAHQQKHVRVQKRSYTCPICEKKFLEKTTLQKHKDVVHDQKATFKCSYCPERHTTVSKLARHVRSHTGDRPYPCKYCDKNFLKSHHYTRHLRMKHRDVVRTRRGPFGEQEQQYRCDQCDDSFATQDELIYHSAIHATQNLICPLCQEKFADVDAVTAHIKSHVNGTEFMCDYCELIFTTKDKLDSHVSVVHEEELRSDDQAESSIELDDDDDDAINVTEENGEMVVEIKKANDFMITNYQGETADKVDITNSDESEAEDTEITTVEPVEVVKKDLKPSDVTITKLTPSTVVSKRQIDNSTKADKANDQPTSIIKKMEEIKRKIVPQKTPDSVPKKKEKINKVDSNNSGANDKSLRLLEKELQDLKRTNSRSETLKVPAKNVDILKNRKPQVHTSTPKPRPVGIKESQSILVKTIEKKIPERRLITKENKEINREVKDQKNNNTKEDKEKDATDKEPPPKEKNMNNIKNGSSNKTSSEEVVRRSTRPSKIKDYAKMIRDSSQESAESSDNTDEDEGDEEFTRIERSPEPRSKQRRASIKQAPTPKPATVTNATPVVRKRGRPRKDAQQVPTKVRKEDDEVREEAKSSKAERENANPKETDQDNDNSINTRDSSNSEASPSTSGVLVSPTGQTLKKVPIKALPPGVKPLPLPANARLGSGEVCEMQIGKKLVKVQKIVMTKAEVEAMAKKGLVEMKDGTMVLKQGVNPAAVKSTLVDEGEGEKESPSKKDKGTPSRCDFGDDP